MLRCSNAHFRVAVAFALVWLAIGCKTGDEPSQAMSLERSYAAVERVTVRSGDLAVTVDSPERASPEVERIVEEAGGFVERSTATRESSVWLQCRVPAARLDAVMDAIGELGDEERRSVSAADVTEQYMDLETRLRNNVALRDRLQALLDRATSVEDVLAVETELNRIQSEIEILQAQFDRLKSEVELSALSVELQRKRVLGPLGYVSYGIWWALSKLFVIR